MPKVNMGCWGDALRKHTKGHGKSSSFSSSRLAAPARTLSPLSRDQKGAAGKAAVFPESQHQHHRAEHGKVGLELRGSSLIAEQVTFCICLQTVFWLGFSFPYQRAALFLRFWKSPQISPGCPLSSGEHSRTHRLVDSQQRRVMPPVNRGTEEVGSGESSARTVHIPGSGRCAFAFALKDG